LVLGTAVSLAIAAISVPAVLAKPTSGYGPLDPWAYSVIHRSTQATPANYSAVSGPLGVTAYQSFAGVTPKQGERVTSQAGFDWGDAGIGASVVFGALLLLVSVIALGRRYRPRINRSGLATS
jgi:hypothetical protein